MLKLSAPVRTCGEIRVRFVSSHKWATLSLFQILIATNLKRQFYFSRFPSEFSTSIKGVQINFTVSGLNILFYLWGEDWLAFYCRALLLILFVACCWRANMRATNWFQLISAAHDSVSFTPAKETPPINGPITGPSIYTKFPPVNEQRISSEPILFKLELRKSRIHYFHLSGFSWLCTNKKLLNRIERKKHIVHGSRHNSQQVKMKIKMWWSIWGQFITSKCSSMPFTNGIRFLQFYGVLQLKEITLKLIAKCSSFLYVWMLK